MRSECMAALEPTFVFEKKDNLGGQRELTVKIMMLGNNVGHFDFSGTVPLPTERLIDNKKIQPILSSLATISLGIGIDDEYTGRGWAKLMIAKMIESIGDEMSDGEQLFIDADASEGFWKHVGFEENRHYKDTKLDIKGAGYEAFITFQKLKMYITPKGGKRTRRKK